MACTIYTVEIESKPKLGYMARPRGGDWLEDEILSVSQQGINVIVSLLEPEEVTELDLKQESNLCARHGLQFVTIPIRDRGVPALDDATMSTLSTLRSLWRGGKAIVTHCRMGYGRAPMIAACIMVSEGCGTAEALTKLSAARGIPVPETKEQRAWVENYAAIIANTDTAK
jgi:protein-tyrosine phosphatase